MRLGRAANPLGGVLFVLAFGVAIAACSGTVTVAARLQRPAVVPIRAYPNVWVVPASSALDERVADALVRHLRETRRTNARRVSERDIAEARTRGTLPTATVSVLLGTWTADRTRAQWGSRPDTVCGPFGCYTTYRPHFYEWPAAEGQLTIVVVDTGSGETVQRHVLRAREDGSSPQDAQERVEGRLLHDLLDVVDEHVDQVDVELLAFDSPESGPALALAERGDLHAARQRLEQYAGTLAGRALPPRERARLYHDIAQLRRFDDQQRGTPDERLERAARLARRAVELDPDESRHRALVGEIAEQRTALALLREQHEAAAHNFALPTAPSVPEPPPSYRVPSQRTPMPAPAASPSPTTSPSPTASPAPTSSPAPTP